VQVVEAVAHRGERLEPFDFGLQLVVVGEGSLVDHRPGPAVGVRIERQRETGLLEVVEAGGGARLFPRLVERGEQHSGQDRDDGDHDEEFDQSKRKAFHNRVNS